MSDDHREVSERRRAHRLIRRVIRFLEHAHGWHVQFLPIERDARVRKRIGFDQPIVGGMDPEAQMIYIEPSYPDLMGVLLHECLHAILPEATEDEVLELEGLVRRHLTSRQSRDFLKIVAFRLI